MVSLIDPYANRLKASPVSSIIFGLRVSAYKDVVFYVACGEATGKCTNPLYIILLFWKIAPQQWFLKNSLIKCFIILINCDHLWITRKRKGEIKTPFCFMWILKETLFLTSLKRKMFAAACLLLRGHMKWICAHTGTTSKSMFVMNRSKSSTDLPNTGPVEIPLEFIDLYSNYCDFRELLVTQHWWLKGVHTSTTILLLKIVCAVRSQSYNTEYSINILNRYFPLFTHRRNSVFGIPSRYFLIII